MPVATRVNDSGSAIGRSGFDLSSDRGRGDLGDAVHAASANGSEATYRFTGGFVQVLGELSTGRGAIGVTIDGGTQRVVDTGPADGRAGRTSRCSPRPG